MRQSVHPLRKKSTFFVHFAYKPDWAIGETMISETMRIYSRPHDFIQKAYRCLDKQPLSERNKQLIRLFAENLEAKGCGVVRVEKCLRQAYYVGGFFKKDLDTVQREDIETVLAQINRHEKWSHYTKVDYKRIIRQFFRWYLEYYEIDNPRLIKAIKSIRISSKNESPKTSEILTDADIDKMITKGARNDKERAFLMVLYESGFRIGEHLGIKIKHLRFAPNKVYVEVNGKTGRRTVVLYTSAGYLGRWLDQHPFKDNNEAYLWVPENVNFIKAKVSVEIGMRYMGAKRLIKRCRASAGLNKRCNPHWFRHSRATRNAKLLKENELDTFMGWVPGSRQASTYVHINQSDVEDKLDVLHGIKQTTDLQTTVSCSCGLVNTTQSRYCTRCGRPLNVETALTDQRAIDSEIGVSLKSMLDVFKDPQMLQDFELFRAKRKSLRD